ncbi:hypothetical protein GGH12_006301, partial [Coemansia sp. RSA 1822]
MSMLHTTTATLLHAMTAIMPCARIATLLHAMTAITLCTMMAVTLHKIPVNLLRIKSVMMMVTLYAITTMTT